MNLYRVTRAVTRGNARRVRREISERAGIPRDRSAYIAFDVCPVIVIAIARAISRRANQRYGTRNRKTRETCG